MHILNFLVAIILPYITLLNKLAPPETIPDYFYSEEAAFMAGIFCVIVFFWAGYLRNVVSNNRMSEQKYFGILGLLLFFMCVSKIIFTLPYTWISSTLAFGLGVLAVPKGQTNPNKSLWLIIVPSIVLLAFSTFILVGMGWFGLTSGHYYYYQAVIMSNLDYGWDFITSWM